MVQAAAPPTACGGGALAPEPVDAVQLQGLALLIHQLAAAHRDLVRGCEGRGGAGRAERWHLLPAVARASARVTVVAQARPARAGKAQQPQVVWVLENYIHHSYDN